MVVAGRERVGVTSSVRKTDEALGVRGGSWLDGRGIGDE